jgi:uncharacterized protein YukE
MPMITDIALGPDDLGAHLAALSAAVPTLAASADDAPSGTHDAAAAKSHRSRFVRVGTAIARYQALLERDHRAISRARDRLEEADRASRSLMQ